ncbi:hypothetical protein BJY04DRAFT_223101 [Aspergillus karnatakaensis]|uniref:SRPBCC domain-containing protein n=1 Tax=Aspergillus karnatakaensis TaxID=1810916 RepID=UPI003CCCCC30
MASIITSIEISASPAIVREKFLDFPSLPTYTPTGFITSISPASPTTRPQDLQKGDKLHCTVGYGKFNITPTLVSNTESEFSWCGSLAGVFTGTHYFRFEELDDGKKTRFVHGEDFGGVLAGLYGEGWLGWLVGAREGAVKGFEGFNADFKGWVEGRSNSDDSNSTPAA